MSFNFTQARGHVPSSFLTLGHWAEKEEKLKEEEEKYSGLSSNPIFQFSTKAFHD